MLIKRDCICTPVGKNRPLHIYLPDNYNETEEQYPVMYFFDGHNLFSNEDATYGKSWGLKEFLDSWNKPMIIVGIECGHEGRERLNEYSPYSWDNDYIGKVEGIGDSILDWMVEELKPMIDREFRTYYFREATGIGGSSMGGLMSLYGVTKYNRYFSKAACLSSTILPCYRKLSNLLKRSEIDPDTRIWLSFGENEAKFHGGKVNDVFKTKTSAYTDKLIGIIESKNASAVKFIQANGGHCEADWEKQIPGFMDYLWM